MRMARLGRRMRLERLGVPVAFLVLFVLGGCLYPNARTTSEGDLWRDVTTVERAVQAYVERQGILPVARPEKAIDPIEGAPIDMSALYPDWLNPIPSSAFERGGVYRYMAVPVGDGFAVRLADLRILSAVERVQRAVQAYVEVNGRLPSGEAKGPSELTIDYASLALNEPVLTSPYSGHALSLLMTPKGRVFVDYLLDLALLRQAVTAEGRAVDGDGDARRLFIDRTLFVPVASVPLVWHGEEPEVRLGDSEDSSPK